jgi:phosphoribosyl-AMP cyclohydrolase
MADNPFATRGATISKRDIEESALFAPKFGADGLIVCVTNHARTNETLMVAYMNEDALALTLETGIAHYWSRSRSALWRKGDTSGQVQRVIEMRVDCDQDAIVIAVDNEEPQVFVKNKSDYVDAMLTIFDGTSPFKIYG